MLKSITSKLSKTVLFLLTILLVVWAITLITPKPLISLLSINNEQKVGTFPNNYAELEAKVTKKSDIVYPSALPNNTLNIYLPTDMQEQDIPVILWAHGGGFFRGDKDMAEQYPVMLAAHGYAVVSINYALVPKANFLEQVKQFDDAWSYTQSVATTYHFDMNKVIVGGTSAGGFIAAQYLLAATNPTYAEKFAIAPNSERKIIGGLLNSAPLSFTDIQKLAPTKYKLPLNYLIWQLGWAVTDNRNWRNDSSLRQFDFNTNITENLPPLFITDGNTGSFQAEAEATVQALKANGNNVTSLFFDPNTPTGHSYMLKMDTAESQLCQEQTLAYLQTITSKA